MAKPETIEVNFYLAVDEEGSWDVAQYQSDAEDGLEGIRHIYPIKITVRKPSPEAGIVIDATEIKLGETLDASLQLAIPEPTGD